MENLTALLEGAANQLGRTFFLAGVLPMFVFFGVLSILLGDLVVINVFALDAEPLMGIFSGAFATVVILALATGIVPILLNRAVIRFFEGYGVGRILFAPLKGRFVRVHRAYYAPTQALREERIALLKAYEQTGDFDEEADDALHMKLQATHQAREQDHRLPRLPFNADYLLPTAFGNVWATAEEIPRVRYGMDGMVFWPYMRTIVTQENPPLIANIDGQKLLMDITLHLTFVCMLLAPVSMVMAVVLLEVVYAIYGVGLIVAALLLYQAAVRYGAAMNRLIVQTYDLYRWDLLKYFGLTPPDDLDDEYWLWHRLGAFLQRSEPFYFQYFGDDEDAV